jgi:hypothetical protein
MRLLSVRSLQAGLYRGRGGPEEAGVGESPQLVHLRVCPSGLDLYYRTVLVLVGGLSTLDGYTYFAAQSGCDFFVIN